MNKEKMENGLRGYLGIPILICGMLNLFFLIAGWFWFGAITNLKYGSTSIVITIILMFFYQCAKEAIKELEQEGKFDDNDSFKGL